MERAVFPELPELDSLLMRTMWGFAGRLLRFGNSRPAFYRVEFHRTVLSRRPMEAGLPLEKNCAANSPAWRKKSICPARLPASLCCQGGGY
jgi:hypothetical protein